MSYPIGDRVAILQSEIPIKHSSLALPWSTFYLDQTGQRESPKLCNGISGAYAELCLDMWKLVTKSLSPNTRLGFFCMIRCLRYKAFSLIKTCRGFPIIQKKLYVLVYGGRPTGKSPRGIDPFQSLGHPHQGSSLVISLL